MLVLVQSHATMPETVTVEGSVRPADRYQQTQRVKAPGSNVSQPATRGRERSRPIHFIRIITIHGRLGVRYIGCAFPRCRAHRTEYFTHG